MFFLGEFIKYLWNRKNKFSIHSPFVYNLSVHLEQAKVSSKFKKLRKEIYHYYKTNHTKIEINDLGAGSKKTQSNQRSISSIFNFSSTKGKYADLLYFLSNFKENQQILELGTNLGIGTLHLSMANPTSSVISVEGCSNILNYPKQVFKKYSISNVEFIHSSFSDFLIKQDKNVKFDLIFIDGHHESTALLHYLKLIEAIIHQESLIVLDDIRWNVDMLSFWETCVANEDFNVSIDLFRMGILSKRNGQAKEHFVLKY
ncbi:MAG: class I SAM-dependent methyltransferase [Flavobacteriia bacterium]|nr:class I SAM-dependent methyltransferase [Flavobacteriia bacterium]